MKTIIFSVLLALIFSSCHNPESPSGVPALVPRFSLSDTNGVASRVFHSGEDFSLSASVTNTTTGTLTYHMGHGGPVIVFCIQKNDTTVASSADGFIFVMIAISGNLTPGQVLGADWRGPGTPAIQEKVVLPAGSYTATVSFPNFDNAVVTPVGPIGFTVAE